MSVVSPGNGRYSAEGSWGLIVRRFAPLVLLAVVASAGVTSCATPTGGQAVPGNPGGSTATPRSSSGPGTRPTTSTPGSGNSPLTKMDPCDLLDSAAMAKLGITGEGEPGKILQARNCRWRVRGPSNTDIYDLGILDTLGLTDVPGQVQVTRLPDIGKHPAVQAKNSGGGQGCQILVGVTESSRVDLAVVSGTDVEKACGLAMEFAKLVEPKLP